MATRFATDGDALAMARTEGDEGRPAGQDPGRTEGDRGDDHDRDTA